VQYFTHYTSWY